MRIQNMINLLTIFADEASIVVMIEFLGDLYEQFLGLVIAIGMNNINKFSIVWARMYFYNKIINFYLYKNNLLYRYQVSQENPMISWSLDETIIPRCHESPLVHDR